MTNWRYVVAGIIRRRVPHSWLFGLMALRGGANGAETDPVASAQQVHTLLRAAGVDIAGRTIVELGSGRTARSGLQLLAGGARRVTLVDLYATPLEQPAHRAMLLADCDRLGLQAADALSRLTVVRGDFLSLAPPVPELRPDLALSVAVLEHVRDPALVLSHCYAWLRPGGVTFHIVDLRDHNLSFRYPFEMLTYTDTTWERWFDLGGGFHLNRWRAPDYRQALTAAGFTNTQVLATMRDHAGAQAVRPRLAPRFQSLEDEDLATIGVALYGERPG